MSAAVGRAPDVVIVTLSSGGRQVRHWSGAAAAVLAVTPVLADPRPILVPGSDRDLVGGVSFVVRERAE
jgi:hypothetical protein